MSGVSKALRHLVAGGPKARWTACGCNCSPSPRIPAASRGRGIIASVRAARSFGDWGNKLLPSRKDVWARWEEVLIAISRETQASDDADRGREERSRVFSERLPGCLDSNQWLRLAAKTTTGKSEEMAHGCRGAADRRGISSEAAYATPRVPFFKEDRKTCSRQMCVEPSTTTAAPVRYPRIKRSVTRSPLQDQRAAVRSKRHKYVSERIDPGRDCTERHRERASIC